MKARSQELKFSQITNKNPVTYAINSCLTGFMLEQNNWKQSGLKSSWSNMGAGPNQRTGLISPLSVISPSFSHHLLPAGRPAMLCRFRSLPLEISSEISVGLIPSDLFPHITFSRTPSLILPFFIFFTFTHINVFVFYVF